MMGTNFYFNSTPTITKLMCNICFLQKLTKYENININDYGNAVTLKRTCIFWPLTNC